MATHMDYGDVELLSDSYHCPETGGGVTMVRAEGVVALVSTRYLSFPPKGEAFMNVYNSNGAFPSWHDTKHECWRASRGGSIGTLRRWIDGEGKQQLELLTDD